MRRREINKLIGMDCYVLITTSSLPRSHALTCFSLIAGIAQLGYPVIAGRSFKKLTSLGRHAPHHSRMQQDVSPSR
ncbi:hypothetical protein K449DRAFT_238624 [Hypoxylon sp. EC38]|nr:hypothetical protein K449DRAFT_238624 [Hypoxylon sp. EC38]